MSKILVIAEKPSVARDYARVLGCKTKRDGYIEGPNHIVTWALGHLIQLAEPQQYDKKYKSWKYDDLPIKPEKIKLRVSKNTTKQFNIIKKYMMDDDIDSIICGTDSGREGELIFRYIYEHAKCKKPFSRLWISSMTDISIKEGFNTMKPGAEYDNLYYSARCRSHADWLVGINASRAFTIQYGALLSIGRVQTPTLGIIVQRYNEITNFKPKDYYEIDGIFNDFKAIWYDEKEKNSKIFDKSKVDEIIDKVTGKDGEVKSIKKEEKKVPPPLLYDLTELQRDGNKKFGYSAQTVLSIAQSLYEKRKMVTYPRTDSRYLTDDMKGVVKTTLNKLRIEPYNKYIDNITEVKFTKRIINNAKVSDHHAIIPTNVAPNLSSLTKDEFNIYNLIVCRFIEVFYPYYRYQVTEIKINVEDEIFLAKGKVVVEEGWTCISRDKKDKDQIMPKLEKKQVLPLTDTQVNKKQTKPPKQYTEATLLSAMEHAGRFVEDEAIKEKLKESGLGTPATRASIIERLLQVGYIERKGKAVIPTEKGIKLIAVVPEELKSPVTTGKWEKGLFKISNGDMEPVKFMNSIKRYVDFLVNYTKTPNRSVIFQNEYTKKRKPKNSLGKCPNCDGGLVIKNSKSYYCTNWKQGCKFTIWINALERYGVKIDDATVKKLLKDKQIDGVQATLPQTGEKCTVTIFINDRGLIEMKNLKRV